MADITIVNGVYKPTYNWGAPSCSYRLHIYFILLARRKSWQQFVGPPFVGQTLPRESLPNRLRSLSVQTERLPEREIDTHYILYIHTHASGYKIIYAYIYIYIFKCIIYIYLYIYICISHTHTYIYIYISNSRVIKTDEQGSPVNQQFRKTIFQQFYDIAQKMTAKIHGFPTERNQ